jgi:hypothetical protein
LGLFLKRMKYVYSIVVSHKIKNPVCSFSIPNSKLPDTAAHNRHWLAVNWVFTGLQ